MNDNPAMALALMWVGLSLAISVACYVTGSAWPLLAFAFAPSYGSEYP